MSAWSTLDLIENDAHVVTVSLNRPDQRNAVNRAMAEELVDCLAQLRARRGLRVLVLTGAGTTFCAGGDLTERLERGPEHARLQREAMLQAIELIERMPFPVLAMVNGPALAGGLELALGCDLRIASADASFALPEVRSAGGFPGAGGPVRLARMIGRGRAGLLVYSARRFTAREAFELGFVEKVVPADSLRDETYALAGEIARNSPTGIRAAKVLLVRGEEMGAAGAAALSRALRDPQDRSPDFEEAVSAWQERRSPLYGDCNE